VLKELGVGALGALAGILARTNTEPGPVQPVAVVNTPAAPVPVDPQPDPQPGYQPDPQESDKLARAARVARAQQVLREGALSPAAADLHMLRGDMHESARRAASPGLRRPFNQFLKVGVPGCGNVTGGNELYGSPPGWQPNPLAAR
jgi:hypothetical protein